MADRVHRVTMFKMPKADDREKMIEQYKVLGAKNERVRQGSRGGRGRA